MGGAAGWLSPGGRYRDRARIAALVERALDFEIQDHVTAELNLARFITIRAEELRQEARELNDELLRYPATL